MWCCRFTEEKPEVQESPSLGHPAIHLLSKYGTFSLTPWERLGNRPQAKPIAGRRGVVQGQIRSIPANDFRCVWGVAAVGRKHFGLSPPTTDFIQHFWLFDPVFSFAVAAGPPRLCCDGQGIRQYYSHWFMSKLSPGEAVIPLESPFPFSAIWSSCCEQWNE